VTRSLLHPAILIAVAAAACGARSPGQNTQTRVADWVIDGCRVTFKGTPVPFGKGPGEFVKLFGAPSDSLIQPWKDHPPFRIYTWAKSGLQTEPWSDRHPDLFGGIEILFDSKPPEAGDKSKASKQGISTVEFKPYGIVDSSSIRRILAEGFHHSFALQGDEPSFLELDMGRGYWLSILPVRGMHGRFRGFTIHFNAPDSDTMRTYPEVLARLGNSCQTPNASSPDASSDSADAETLRAGLEAIERLEKIGFDKIGEALSQRLKTMLPDTSDAVAPKAPQDSTLKTPGR